ncbi:flagellar protein FliS [Hydrogenobacter sp. T-2]|uniref:flagellar export chaperone FliS n=1 Tax=Pampinifervens diazotrophicum TaxID=1632018 RepID=UPI002B25AF11|nr:flagellar export chaperone FliS [Hydrogenobacter sp. T-2]WPM32374.1 flagellar protein FliS [Hydrogenobacter sp. T-2]
MNAYLENMVLTANPVRQVILLYEKAISCLDEAVELMEKGSVETEEIRRKYEAMGRATEILTVLDTTLNMDQGGEIAKTLREVYQALINDLIRITVEGDEPQTLRKVVRILTELKESWEEVEKKIYGRPEATAPAV